MNNLQKGNWLEPIRFKRQQVKGVEKRACSLTGLVYAIFHLYFFCLPHFAAAQHLPQNTKGDTMVNRHAPRFAAKPVGLLDLDNDGDPDVLRSFLNDTIPVQWIDDDEDMTWKDTQGDIDNDCLMIDRNQDGKYGDALDLVLDWVDEDGDGKADLQLVADNANRTDKGWTPGHFMIAIDTDNDGVFNFINWQTLELEAWEHENRSRFYQDYAGNALFLKIHTSVFNMADTRFNWENPFLFYDMDGDGLSEMAIRLGDNPVVDLEKPRSVRLTGRITDARLTFDLDNDNGYNNEFDFDMSLKFSGRGFDYSRHIHRYKKLKGLPAADSFFYDARWRQMTELVYVDHQAAYREVIEGDWAECSLVFDEDDDCERWERVEFYEPKDLFKIGAKNGGLDNNPQADAAGDRGEWDKDNSGKGKLYMGSFDGRIHLYGAEWGAWRIDEGGRYYQGWQGWRNGADTIANDGYNDEPFRFASVRYADTDNNGFFDEIAFDLDRDRQFEQVVSLQALGISDKAVVLDIAKFTYKDYQSIFAKAANQMWQNATTALAIAKQKGVQVNWYRFFTKGATLQQRYHNGFWLQFFLYRELRNLGEQRGNTAFVTAVDKAYFSGNWQQLKKVIPTKKKK